MGNIEILSKIKRETLSGENYFQSLLEQALYSEILTDGQLEKIQMDSLSLLAKKVEQYNQGDSSSIRVEAAQSLLASIMFTLGVWLKAYPNPDDAVAELLNSDLESLYKKGRERIENIIQLTKTLHDRIINQLVQTKNVFYNETVIGGIEGFFKLYSPEFTAQEIHITADYPVHHMTERLEGIEFIHKYLECIYCENYFCAQFQPEDVHRLLCGYSEDYAELLINIYEPVLVAAMGCVLTDKNINELSLTLEDLQSLYQLFYNKEREEIITILTETVNKVSVAMSLSKFLERYLLDSLPQIAASIEIGIQLNTLERVFLIS